ncbi:hypothetical protein ACPZ19_37565 [Amycolatopsis lurida]
MSGFEAKIEEIRQTGRAASRAGDIVGGVNAASAWPAGHAGMPGAKAVAKLDAVRQAWQQIQTGTVSDLDGHAANINAAADHYTGNEQAAHDALTLKEAPPGGVEAI